MAYLEDIPKYAFGTTHVICPDGEEEEPASIPGESAPSASSSRSVSTGSSAEGSGDSGCCSGTLKNGQNIDLPTDSKEPSTSKRRVIKPPIKISETKFKSLILHAVQTGCRHFDCAPLYKTQSHVGAALREAMISVPRQNLFITSKLPPNMMRPENIMRSISKSIEELQCSYLDLFLIHAPFSTKHITDDNFYPLDAKGNLLLDEDEHLLENAWRKLVDLKRMGFTRYIGLSNVNLEQVIRLNNIHHIDVVQNEYHIYNQDREIFDYCEEIDVHFEAYAAMGNPDKACRENKPNVAQDPIVQRVARENRLSIAEVNIQWVYQQPLSYVIRCDNPRQLDENLRAAKCISLPVNDLIDLDSLNRDVRLYRFDEHKGITRHREYPFKKSSNDKEPLSERLYQQRIQHHLARPQKRHNKSDGASSSSSNNNNNNSNNNNNNNESDLSSSDCSDAGGEKLSSNLKSSLSQSDSSITTTIARSSTPTSVTDETITATAATSATDLDAGESSCKD